MRLQIRGTPELLTPALSGHIRCGVELKLARFGGQLRAVGVDLHEVHTDGDEPLVVCRVSLLLESEVALSTYDTNRNPALATIVALARAESLLAWKLAAVEARVLRETEAECRSAS